MKQDDQLKESGNAQSLAVAAALAILGVSVGVNVQDLLAASPPEQNQSKQFKVPNDQFKVDSTQDKLPSAQEKHKGTVQQKLPAVQQKDMGMPGVKPVDPMRP